MTAPRRRGDLDGFDCERVSLVGVERDVYSRGTGPSVVVLAELPGITPTVIGFADRLVEHGFTAVIPHLFGRPGHDPYARGRWGTTVDMLVAAVPLCVSKEFVVFATGRTSPAVEWLRALARREHERCGGPGVGVVGMCFTGGFALAMATSPEVLAPVMAQPSLPLAIGSTRARTVDVSDPDLALIERRCADGELEVLGLRFCGDRLAPGARFRSLEERLGDAFTAVELPDESAHPDAAAAPHSTLTEHLVDEPGEPTRRALDQVLDHLGRRLLA